ncbi:hypothetical protein [Streptomyces griseus]|uniref:hypothetical protein n=1 Tax=Streptomyces griseus TaxID=1911 RepID=UPI000B307CED|nr:hypothetical protein [Streptomyces griseus]
MNEERDGGFGERMDTRQGDHTGRAGPGESGEHADGEQHGFEEQLRDLLAGDAYAIRPSPAPYPAIRRQGVRERRRRFAAGGAALVALAALPVGAHALTDGDRGVDTASGPTPSVSATRAATPSPAASPSGPTRPATSGQLLDGVTFQQAARGLEMCLAYDKQHAGSRVGSSDLGKPADYRIILAMHSTGDSNAPGDGIHVVAVKEKPKQTRLICNIKDGETQGLNVSVGGTSAPEDGAAVYADINSGKLYQQSFLDKGNWKLPFRWGIIGTVRPSVAKVTVSYGDSSATAVLDHGWFVADGTLNQQVTLAPHIKGYDAGGKLVYDSDNDKTYERTLP